MFICFVAFLSIALPLAAQTDASQDTTFEGRPAIVLSNDRLRLTILKQGGAFGALVLKDDPEQINALWNPAAMAREAGQTSSFGFSTGHFVCVDGFGPVSPEERAAGLEGHGEAHRLPWELKESTSSGGVSRLTFQVKLPVHQEVLTRTVTIAAGGNVVAVDSELESLLAFDRPVVWAEHATIGSPFLEPGVTVVDLSGSRCKTRPYPRTQSGRPGRMSHRLPPGEDFTWPNAPLLSGGTADLRAAPDPPSSGDHTTCLMDPSRELVFVTALHPRKRLLLGYLFRRSEFPWLQNWENYPPTRRMARGLEFSTQPFDVPRREAISLGTLFDAPTYRWLPAKSKIPSRFLMFFTRTPEGFTRVSDVRQEGGSIFVTDSTSGKSITLSVHRPL